MKITLFNKSITIFPPAIWLYFKLFKNKTFEYQFETSKEFVNKNYFQLKLSWSRKTHYAGLEFEFSLFKLFWVMITICDNRHWNFAKDRWCLPSDSLEDQGYDDFGSEV